MCMASKEGVYVSAEGGLTGAARALRGQTKGLYGVAYRTSSMADSKESNIYEQNRIAAAIKRSGFGGAALLHNSNSQEQSSPCTWPLNIFSTSGKNYARTTQKQLACSMPMYNN